MNNIVINNNDQALTTSRLVAATFDRQHKDVLKSIKNLDCSEDFNRRNFALIDFKDVRNRTQQEYTITKDGFIFLVMGFTGKEASRFKEQYISAFNKMEEEIRTKGRLPTSFAEALRLAADTQEQLEDTKLQLDTTKEINKLQEKELAKQAPKVEYCDNVLQSKSTLTTTEVAQCLDISATALNAILKTLGIIWKVNGTWVMKGKYKGQGYAETKTYTYLNSKKEQATSLSLVWTEKGRKMIIEEAGPIAKAKSNKKRRKQI